MKITGEMQSLGNVFIIPEVVQVLPKELYPEDSFACIAGRIMQHLYECMKTGMQPQEHVVGPKALGISQYYWLQILGFLQDAGLISGVETIRSASYLGEPGQAGSMAQVKIADISAVQVVETQMAQAKLLEKVDLEGGRSWSNLDFGFSE